VIVGLVLAAGASTRMGADRNKLLEEIEGRALVEGVVDALVDAGLDRTLVVLGHEAGAVKARLGSRSGVAFLEHAGWPEGMGSSIAAGARAVLASAADPAILVCVGDLPGLRADAVAALVQAYRDADRADAICVPVFEGRAGHPVLFGPLWARDLAALSGDRGARALIDGAGERVIHVACPNPGIVDDVDLPADLARWHSRSGHPR
jgi:molybdenum cofactor cytidylyltransferase